MCDLRQTEKSSFGCRTAQPRHESRQQRRVECCQINVLLELGVFKKLYPCMHRLFPVLPLDSYCCLCPSSCAFSIQFVFSLPRRPAPPLPAVSLLQMLIHPMNAFPWVINGVVEAGVSKARLENVLLLALGTSVAQEEDDEGAPCFSARADGRGRGRRLAGEFVRWARGC